MILIVSQTKHESSTERVIEWLEHLGASFTRINGDDIYSRKGILIRLGEETSISVNEGISKLARGDFNIGWYRRWSVREYSQNYFEKAQDIRNATAILNYLSNDEQAIKGYLLKHLKIKKWLTNPFRYNIDKLTVLEEAQNLGLKIPSTLVTSSKEEVRKFRDQHKTIITKDLSNCYHVQSSTFDRMISRTIVIDDERFSRIPDFFPHTTFQKLICKSYELRIFFLEEQFYAMAIFSQSDEQTSVDFRNFNHQKPNRFVPFSLPATIRQQLLSLIKRLQLNTGSFDIIVDDNGDFIFLEVNPVGQFGMTSFPCNYQIEKKIAEYLIEHDNEQEST